MKPAYLNDALNAPVVLDKALVLVLCLRLEVDELGYLFYAGTDV